MAQRPFLRFVYSRSVSLRMRLFARVAILVLYMTQRKYSLPVQS